MQAETTLGGWKGNLTKAKVTFYTFSGCKHKTESIMSVNNQISCFKCGKRYPADSFKLKTLRKTAATCAKCGRLVSITDSNCSYILHHYMCESANCNNIIGLKFNKKLMKPMEILQVSLNKDISRLGSKKIYFHRIKSKLDKYVVNLLQILAMNDDSRFNLMSSRQKAAVMIIKEKYVGYILWSDNLDYSDLKQVFVLREHRRKGYASRMLKWWVKNVASIRGPKFGIESPNDKMLNLLLKEGYARKEERGIKSDKFFCTPSF